MRSPTPNAADLIAPAAPPVNSNQRWAINWKKYRRLALPLSFVAGAITGLVPPIGLLLFVALLVFTVGRYCRDHQSPLRALQGAKMGAFNGLISFLVAAAVRAALFHAEYRQQMMVELHRRLADNPDPQFQHILQWAGTNQGFAVLVIFSLIFFLVIFLIVSSFIGAVSVSFSAGKDRR